MWLLGCQLTPSLTGQVSLEISGGKIQWLLTYPIESCTFPPMYFPHHPESFLHEGGFLIALVELRHFMFQRIDSATKIGDYLRPQATGQPSKPKYFPVSNLMHDALQCS